MKQLLIEIEDDIAAKLEAAAPGRSRRQPDSAGDAYLDPPPASALKLL